MLGLGMGAVYALIVVAIFVGFFILLDRMDLLEPYNLDMSGPFLMWKTKKGRSLINRISKKERFWTWYGNIGLVLVGISMVFIFSLVAWSAYLASSIPAESAPTADQVLAIPGINPFIPIWLGIAGLAISIITHEFSHGILARVADVKVKALGLIFLVVPMGAFVEPDEDEVEELSRTERGRLYAAGPTTNIVIAIVLVLIFSTVFMGAVTPKNDGLMISSIQDDSPADTAGLKPGEKIVRLNGTEMRKPGDLQSLSIRPGENFTLITTEEGKERIYDVRAGLIIYRTTGISPAREAGLKKGDILVKMDNRTVYNRSVFLSILDDKKASQTLNVTYQRKTEGTYVQNKTVLELADKYEAYEEMYPQQNTDDFRGEAYMGVSVGFMGITIWDVERVSSFFVHPFKGADTPGEFLEGFLKFIALPIYGLSPVPEDATGLYEVTGPLSALPPSFFWGISDLIYWVFWLNLMVGLFNALPAVPLDGGFLFNDAMSAFVEKLGIKGERNEQVVDGITFGFALLILFMIIWQLVGPHVM